MIEQFYDLRPDVLELDRKALELCREPFRHVEEIRDYNQSRPGTSGAPAATASGMTAVISWRRSSPAAWALRLPSCALSS